jgi:DNA-binding NarL/FixJ family response regulator
MAFRVMLVDDHAVVRSGLRRLLDLEGDMRVVAEHGDPDAAYADLQRLLPGGLDVVVLDMSMPRASGLAALGRIKQRWPLLPVLVFSMHDSAAMVQQAQRAGAAGYFTKGSEPDALVQALRLVALGERGVLSADLASRPAPPAKPPPHQALSPREFEVLRGLVEGLTLDEIAARLRIAAKTVSNVQTHIRQRLGVNTAIELLRYAQTHALFDSETGAAPGQPGQG